MRSLVQRSVVLLILSVSCAAICPAQVRFYASQPNIDSFPVVRIGVGVTINGIAATDLQASNFAVTSDGIPVSGLELLGCDAPLNAAIAIVVDTSASMKMSVGAGTPPQYSYTAFRDCFSRLVERVPSGSLFTVVPFGDSATYSYPRSAPFFYQAAVDADTTALLNVLHGLTFDTAGTYVDAGIMYAAQVLRAASVGRRAIVLVTDDYIDNSTEITDLLQRNSISLYVMQVRPDSGIVIAPNRDVARATAGGYFEAPDTVSYPLVMSTIADRIFSTRCTLRYLDMTVCPWLKTHDVAVTLKYKAISQSVGLQYSLGFNTVDSSAPRLCTDSTLAYRRTAIGLKDYPCQSPLRDGVASALQNFRAGRTVVHSDSVWVPLTVIDTLYPADGDVTIIDINGNESTVHIHYSPKPDTIAPQFDPLWYESGAYQVHVREARGWDRGIQSLTLDPLATNVVVDLLKYYKKDSATAVLHIHDLSLPVDACIIATDSAGNVSRLCMAYTPNAPDTLPPVLTADAVPEPRTRLSGTITEHRPNDTGIRDVLVIPGPNTTSGSQTRISSRETDIAAQLVDSLYAAVLYVRSTDSAGNEMRDSVVYQPLADAIRPVVQYSVSGTAVQLTTTEVSPWDRGLRSVTIQPGAINASLTTASYSDPRHWSGSMTIVDRMQDASFSVVAIDSAMNSELRSITIPGTPAQTPDYMGDSIIDFGTHLLPISMRKNIIIRNTNSFAMTVSIPTATGDDSVFSIVEPNQFPLSAHNAEQLDFDWHPSTAGHWRAVYTLYSGTDKIGTITVIGVSIGVFRLSADTVAQYPGAVGKDLHVRLEAVPTVLNVDTIRFTLHYDKNVVEFFNPSNCAQASSLCGYTMNVAPSVDGLSFSLTRPPHGPAIPFDASSAQITLPLQTYVTAVTSTPVWFSDIYTSAGEITDTIDGLVTSLDTCGTPVLRRHLQGRPLVEIVALSPNPASDKVTVKIQASEEIVSAIEWIDVAGKVRQHDVINLMPGTHDYILGSPSNSGSYDLVVSFAGGTRSRWRVQVVR